MGNQADKPNILLLNLEFNSFMLAQKGGDVYLAIWTDPAKATEAALEMCRQHSGWVLLPSLDHPEALLTRVRDLTKKPLVGYVVDIGTEQEHAVVVQQERTQVSVSDEALTNAPLVA